MTTTTNSLDDTSIIDEDLSRDKYQLILNNNEVYEKVRPLTRITNILKETKGHGDDTSIQISKDQEKHTGIPPMSSSSNEFSLEMDMRITDTSNEALKTDDENGMTKPYFISEKDIILSDVSLQQQRLPADEYEYEIDLGNGWITKSISSYQSQAKQQQRTTSILSADSIQPITTFKIPFTNTFYKQPIQSKQENIIDYSNEPNVLFNSHDYIQRRRWPELSFRTITIFSIGTTIIIFIIVVVFFVF
jgi:hypothetical protein